MADPYGITFSHVNAQARQRERDLLSRNADERRLRDMLKQTDRLLEELEILNADRVRRTPPDLYNRMLLMADACGTPRHIGRWREVQDALDAVFDEFQKPLLARLTSWFYEQYDDEPAEAAQEFVSADEVAP